MHLENVPSKEPGREEETKLFQFEILKLRALYQTRKKEMEKQVLTDRRSNFHGTSSNLGNQTATRLDDKKRLQPPTTIPTIIYHTPTPTYLHPPVYVTSPWWC
jgi:hypothetical protein